MEGAIDMDLGIQIPNRHPQFVPPKFWTANGEYLSLYENAHGEQLVLNVNRATRRGHFSSGDVEWELDPVSEEKIMPDFNFSAEELLWYISCWMARLSRPSTEEIGRESCWERVCQRV